MIYNNNWNYLTANHLTVCKKEPKPILKCHLPNVLTNHIYIYIYIYIYGGGYMNIIYILVLIFRGDDVEESRGVMINVHRNKKVRTTVSLLSSFSDLYPEGR